MSYTKRFLERLQQDLELRNIDHNSVNYNTELERAAQFRYEQQQREMEEYYHHQQEQEYSAMMEDYSHGK